MFEHQIDYFLKSKDFNNSFEDAAYTLKKITDLR